MKLLFAVPHYYREEPSAKVAYGSTGKDPAPRVKALAEAILGVHRCFGAGQCTIDIAAGRALPANSALAHEIEIVVCTAGASHLLHELPIRKDLFKHHETRADPRLLGFECHTVFDDCFGSFDYYCYLEDDIVLDDPLFFQKLRQFDRIAGERDLLQPNRYEVSGSGPYQKAYIDGDIARRATRDFQDIEDQPTLSTTIMDVPLEFHRTSNPNSSCFFLNARQMGRWRDQPHFLDRDTGFVGPIESASTLGIMKTFRIYKPARHCAGFLEVRHYDARYIHVIGDRIRVD